jgi:hypothetical protein
MQVTKKTILVPIFADDGTRNKVLLTSVLNQTFFDNLVNHVDPSKRWFPLPEIKNVEDVRGENISETFEDQSSVFIQEGNRSFKAWMIGSSGTGAGSPQLKAKIEAARCVEIGVYIIDKAGNLIGKISSDGLSLEPIAVDSQSVSAKLIKTTDSTIQKLELMFNFSADECDEDLRMITEAEQGGANLLGLRGLLNIDSIIDNETTTSFTAELITEYGTPINKGHDKGLVIGDFALFNVTDNLAVVITTVVESPDGTYTFTFPAQTSADVLRLTPTKAGRDYTDVIANTIVVP